MAARSGQSSASPCSSPDYHVEVHEFLYSVPHALIRVEVDVRVTARTVEVFHRGQRVGVHQRRYMGAPSPARTPTTCPVPTGATPSGRRIGSDVGPAESGRTRKR